METPRIIEIIKRRRDSLKSSSSMTDTSEVLVTRADMTRSLAEEYEDLLAEIEQSQPKT
jgi:hypothetical protein